MFQTLSFISSVNKSPQNWLREHDMRSTSANIWSPSGTSGEKCNCTSKEIVGNKEVFMCPLCGSNAALHWQLKVSLSADVGFHVSLSHHQPLNVHKVTLKKHDSCPPNPRLQSSVSPPVPLPPSMATPTHTHYRSGAVGSLMKEPKMWELSPLS